MNARFQTDFHQRFDGDRDGLTRVMPAEDARGENGITGLAPCAALRNLQAVLDGTRPNFGAREVGMGFGMRASEIQTAHEGWARALVVTAQVV